MKRLVLVLIGILMVIPVAFVAMQDNAPPIHLQITGINRSEYPTVVVNANVTDLVGQPVLGLGIDDFSVVGALVDHMKIVKVENVTDDSLSFSVVLAIDTSGSMAGTPIEKAKEAAISFINSIGANDPVAIVTFDNKSRLVQDFTTDKTVLTNTITNLGYGGETALFEGSALAVATAGNSPVPRRAVIILSDGQQYPQADTGRNDALDNALQVGVPVYTIGQGFGFDRSFMQTLANGTVAQFYESPDPEKLKQIYDALAQTLRSQYIITLTSDLPGDGKVYQLELAVKTDAGSTANAVIPMRARIYKPIVSLPTLPTDAISEPLDVTAQALSDDGITAATFQLNDGTPEAVTATGPYTFTIDPANLNSGPNTITFSATDSTGDTTTVTGNFTVALKPPTVTITGVGDTVDTVTTATITGAAVEGKVQGLIIKVNDAVVGSSLNKESTTVTLNPAKLPPGENTLTAIVRDTAGGRSEFSIKFIVPALPPAVTINGLTAGESIIENRTITVTADSPQTAVTQVVYKVDGKEIATQTEEPFTLDLDVASIGVGNHILTVEATNEGGETGTADVAFVVAPPPTATPTATSTSTNTPIPPTATDTKVPPTNTSVPPTATNTSVPATATNTTVPATDTKVPPTANASQTAQAQTNLVASQVAATSAAAATDTSVPATNTKVPPTANASQTAAVQANMVASQQAATSAAQPTDTDVPPTNTKVPSTNTKVPPTDTKVPPTSTSTTVPTTTSTATTEATVEVTEAVTAEVTEAATAEIIAEVTEAATAEITAEQTEAALGATSTTTATSTNEATAVSTNESQTPPTFTPIPLTAENQGAVGQSQSPLLIGATCLLGLLLLAIVYWFAARRRTR